jgi:hypothetical protein
MPVNPLFIELMAQRRPGEAMQEAKRERLGQMVESARPGLPDQALASVGGLLISAGKKLQARHAPVQPHLTGSPSPASQ